ncbi:MAG TPA: porin, partial [Methylotenera sp.]|nr:porin [Methylotenera sp.]
MNKQIKLAVASALLAAASSANAGIMIPAGDWTLDIGGVVNTYYTYSRTSGDAVGLGGALENGYDRSNNITTGLLPNYLSVSGKTRQNDLDVGFTISINPGSSTKSAGIQSGTTSGNTSTVANQENRQAFLTFGDKSWGSIKVGKDLGIFASDAILNDMTLLGVGSGAGLLAGNTTTLGRIGTGFIYADWKSQIAYSSPNWNGFSFTAGITQAWDAAPTALFGGVTPQFTGREGAGPAFEAKAAYEWAGDVGGKVWTSAITQKFEDNVNGGSERANAWDLGATVNVAGFGLTGYYYDGKGIGTTVQFAGGFEADGDRTDSDGGYVQGTYTLPGVGTKLGLSWGVSKLEGDAVDIENSMWTVGAYHPLTKHLNLVAEYSDVKSEDNAA